MLVRDLDGKIVIISRKDCINNLDYYSKLFDIRNKYITKFMNKVYLNDNAKYKEDNEQNELIDNSELID